MARFNPVFSAISRGYDLAKPLAFRSDPERVHDRTISILSGMSRSGFLTNQLATDNLALSNPRLQMNIPGFGSCFPVGVAAGLDKNGRMFPALLALGFGFVEIGTVTPIPQGGNPQPRVFRLPEDDAIINRMGFPGVGSEEVSVNLSKRQRPGMNIGINIGPNKTAVDSGRAIEDVLMAFERLQPYAGYICVNVSSPNTTGLRQLQRKQPLRHLLAMIAGARDQTASVPLLAKISPDLTDQQLYEVVEAAFEANIDGIVATNTTITRPADLTNPKAAEAGGLSGKPLAPLSSHTVRRIAKMSDGRLPIHAVGGIFTGQDVFAAIASGASAVQLYTSLIYRGPSIVNRIANELLDELDRRNIDNLASIRGELFQLT